MYELRFDFVGRLDARTVLGDGSVRFDARLTRTGVFQYDGRAELRTPEEVFKKSAIDSFRGLAVTDGHQAFVTAANWRQFAVGHISDDVRREGDFLIASVVVKDSSTLARIDSGELQEISMGYSVTPDPTPGVTSEGQHYDSVQRDILGNHAALGPSNWGRAGNSVRLLDGSYSQTMSETRIDAPAASPALSPAPNPLEDAATKYAALQATADRLEAERDAARKDAADAHGTLSSAAATEASWVDARVDARVSLIESARVVLGKDFNFKNKSDRDIRLAVLAVADSKVKAEGKSDDYLAARFDMAIERAASDTAALVNVAVITATPVADNTEPSRLDAALAQRKKDAELAGLAGPPSGTAYVKKY